MKTQAFAPLASALLLAAPVSGQAALSAYSQNFETLAPGEAGTGNNTALSDDGWKVFGSVHDAGGAFLFAYGPGPAPNGSLAYSSIAGGSYAQGGPQQGAQSLVVYSDYSNPAHASGQIVHSSVFQQQVVGAADVGSTWTFSFDAKPDAFAPLAAPSTALAFVQTTDPTDNYRVTGQRVISMGGIPATWGSYSVAFTVTGVAGQLLEFGFFNTATAYAPSAVAYDNVSFAPVPEPATFALMLAGLGLLVAAGRQRQR